MSSTWVLLSVPIGVLLTARDIVDCGHAAVSPVLGAASMATILSDVLVVPPYLISRPGAILLSLNKHAAAVTSKYR